MDELSGKVAVVTGAGGGIGRAHALLLAEHGVHVVVNDLGVQTNASAASVVAEIEAAGGTAVANTDSATWDGSEAIIGAALDTYGRIDIVINNATKSGVDDLWSFSEEVWDLTMDVNLKGYYAMIRAAAPHLCRQGSGVIVNTSSGSGFGHPSAIAYATAKEGVIGLTRTVARELGRFGVRCNAIRPFAAGQSTTEYAELTAKWLPLMALTMGPVPGEVSVPVFDQSQFSPAKIAPFVVWLCTDAAKNVNGRSFNVGGNQVSRLSEPAPERSVHHTGGWDVESLDVAAVNLVGDLQNPFTLDGHPDLKVFED